LTYSSAREMSTLLPCETSVNVYWLRDVTSQVIAFFIVNTGENLKSNKMITPVLLCVFVSNVICFVSLLLVSTPLAFMTDVSWSSCECGQIVIDKEGYLA
jgi:hypothetical protein